MSLFQYYETFCEEHGLPCTRNTNLSNPEYLWHGEISACKVLVPIKVVPVKNDYFLQNWNYIHISK